MLLFCSFARKYVMMPIRVEEHALFWYELITRSEVQ